MLPLFLSSCASTKKKLEQAAQYEAEGRHLEAARKYLDVLRGSSKSEEAILGFKTNSEQAIDQLMREAAQFGDDGLFTQAAENFIVIDDLERAAENADVAMDLPEGYNSDRRSTLDDAIRFVNERAEKRMSEGEFDDAIEDYSLIIDRYDPIGDQLRDASNARIGVHVRWADYELSNSRFRSSLEQADLALQLMDGQNHPLEGEAATIRREALERGTVFTAIVPVWKVGELERAIDSDLIDDFNDGLQLDFWNRPPIFVALADPSLVRREVRQLGYRRAAITRRAAGQVAKRVDADLVVYGLIEEFDVKEYDLKEKIKTAKLEAGGDTSYVEVKGKIRYDAEIIYTIVNENGRVVKEGSVSHRENGSFERGEFDGELRLLDLNRGQRRLFDGQRQREKIDDIEQELIARLAEKYSGKVFDELIRQVR